MGEVVNDDRTLALLADEAFEDTTVKAVDLKQLKVSWHDAEGLGFSAIFPELAKDVHLPDARTV